MIKLYLFCIQHPGISITLNVDTKWDFLKPEFIWLTYILIKI